MDLTISNLCKTYANGIKALDGVNLHIQKGMFGLLGPNGAGKSSLMRTLATLQEADSGTAYLGDINILKEKRAIKQILGYLPQSFGLYAKDTPYSLLKHFARLKGIEGKKEQKKVVETLLKKVNLWEVRKQKLGTFSGGMKQRFGIAQTLLGSPKLIIVDEPTAGLDPEERNRFHSLLGEIGKDIIVLLSTHIVEDVSDLCEQMAIINKGQILIAKPPKEAISELKKCIWQLEVPKDQLTAYQAQFQILSVKLLLGKTHIRVFAKEKPGDAFTAVTPTLEDVYFAHLNSYI